jgi:pimeloyl-ACP methyl ester carboxylesterase
MPLEIPIPLQAINTVFGKTRLSRSFALLPARAPYQLARKAGSFVFLADRRYLRYERRLFVRQRAFLWKFHRIVLAACVCALLSACAHLVTISYPPEAVIHPTFNRRFTTWEGERVQVALAPSLRGEALTYLGQYDQVLLANLVRQRGLHHEYEVAGKGTPLVVYCKNPVVTPREKHYPKSGIVLGVTAVKENRQGQEPLLKLYDTLDPSVVRCARGPNPIAANYTAALAVLLSHSRKVATSSASAFLRPDNPRFATGVYLIHPYDPNKIPILFVHGLISSPISWQNLTNDLCSDPAILQHYQPWFFLYPTGQTVLESAQQLREDLLTTQKLFDPKGAAVASHHVVVIAHSMGGILAHTLVSDSGNAVWNSFANKPFNSLSLRPEERKLVLGIFFFRHQPCIDRVIFLAVPHRGSGLAAGIVGTIGNGLIRRPKTVAEAMRELTAHDPGVVRPYFARPSARSDPTSLISLAPNPLLDSLAALPIRVPFHSIIGDRGMGGGRHSSDGVVPYSSSHLAGAESEKIVPAGHTVFSDEGAVIEIKRILEKNLTRSGHRKEVALRLQSSF